MDSNTSISVVIVNFNGERFLQECLEAVESQTIKPQEIVIIDNDSQDKSVEMIERDFPSVKLIINAENRFFSKGSNQGISEAQGDFILLLNNDCILDQQYLEQAIQPMLDDSRIGAVTGKILRFDGKTIDSAGQEVSRSRKPLDRGYNIEDAGQFDEAEHVLSAGGIAPLLKRAMLEDIAVDGQFFDEDFVQYYEDLDLFWRAHNLGWKCFYNPRATARHYRGATGQSEPATYSWVSKFAFANLPKHLQGHLLKNRYAVMAKNDKLSDWLLSLPWILAYECKIFAYMLLMRPSLLPVYFKGFGFLKIAFNKRKKLKKLARERGIQQYGGRPKWQ